MLLFRHIEDSSVPIKRLDKKLGKEIIGSNPHSTVLQRSFGITSPDVIRRFAHHVIRLLSVLDEERFLDGHRVDEDSEDEVILDLLVRGRGGRGDMTKWDSVQDKHLVG